MILVNCTVVEATPTTRKDTDPKDCLLVLEVCRSKSTIQCTRK